MEQALGKMTKPEFRNPNQIQSLRAMGVMPDHNAPQRAGDFSLRSWRIRGVLRGQEQI
jgi:hypothetical protein